MQIRQKQKCRNRNSHAETESLQPQGMEIWTSFGDADSAETEMQKQKQTCRNGKSPTTRNGNLDKFWRCRLGRKRNAETESLQPQRNGNLDKFWRCRFRLCRNRN